MDVYQAVTSRRAVRGFTDQRVSKEVIERVLSAAAWSPSGSNLQPWNIFVVTGAPLTEIKHRAVERVATADPWDEREYVLYPPDLKSPYKERRSAFGKSVTVRSASRAGLGGAPESRHRQLGLLWAPAALFAPSTAISAARNGLMWACTCRPSCCFFAPKGCSVARKWRGHRSTGPLPRSSTSG